MFAFKALTESAQQGEQHTSFDLDSVLSFNLLHMNYLVSD